ncbi:MAG: DegT/DnrJ/EryC1/StrS family aminotransferase [Mariprofundales bacterium]|nr:DegT/DnrJ/EryC1/StrS family aminotransferase [Mariprofundales bacterium]
MIPHSRPRFSRPLQEAVAALLQSGRVTAGEEVIQLERLLAQRVGTRCAVAVDSGTSAISLALRLLSRDQKGARMLVGIPAFGCASLLWAVRAVGMVPYTLDCDPKTLTLVDGACRTALDAVVVVHPFGMVEPQIEQEWGCPIVEDIAQSAGGEWHNTPLGSWGWIAIASLHATKPWGGVYGGALLLDDDCEEVALRQMIDPDVDGSTAERYVGHHQLSDLHALVARMRIEQSSRLQAQRAEMSALLSGWLLESGAHLCPTTAGNYFRLLFYSATYSAIELVQRFRAAGVAASLPIKAPLSRMVGAEMVGAEEAFTRWVSLPLLVDLSTEERKQMRNIIVQVLS